MVSGSSEFGLPIVFYFFIKPTLIKDTFILKLLMLFDATTKSGRLFQVYITLLEKGIFVGCNQHVPEIF